MNKWLDESLGVGPFFRAIFHRRVPVGLTWWYSLGAACLFLVVLQAVTGILLAMNYVPSPERAYDSVAYITNVAPFGFIVRGLHHWGASAMVVLVIVHMISAFVLGAHKYPRGATWLVGVLLFLITMGFGFTGYLLPWDQKAYWATTVGTNMPGTGPIIGSYLVKLLRGGVDLGAVALSRFYALHVLVLPAMVGLFALVHFALVIWHGVSVPPALWQRGLRGSKFARGDKPEPELAAAYEPIESGQKLDKVQYHDRYVGFKARGPHFWPEVIADDAKISFLVFVVLLGLTVFWGIPTEQRADPSDSAYIPRPEWYFLFLFQMLKYFPGSLEWVGALVVPGILVLVLFVVPFVRSLGERRPRQRPVPLGLLGVGLAAAIVLTIQASEATPPSVVVENGIVLTSQQLRGWQIVQQEGCRSCHVIAGEGVKKGPTLDGIGERVTAADIHFFMEKPKAYNPAATMPALIPPLTHEDVEALTQYLLTLPGSGGKKGEASVPGIPSARQ